MRQASVPPEQRLPNVFLKGSVVNISHVGGQSQWQLLKSGAKATSSRNECGCIFNKTLFTKASCQPCTIVCQRLFQKMAFPWAAAVDLAWAPPGLYGPKTGRDGVFWHQGPEEVGVAGCEEQIGQALSSNQQPRW